MSLSAQYKTDAQKEVEGARIVMGEHNDKETAFYVARAGGSNKLYGKVLTRNLKPHQRAINAKTISPEVSRKILVETFIEANLKGWDNVPMSDVTGNMEDEGLAEFTAENARKLFENLPDVYDDLATAAAEIETYILEKREEEAKN